MVAPSWRKRTGFTNSFKQSKKPFKKTKDDVASRSKAMALQLEEVPDFPRGGGSSKFYDEVDAEFDADEHVETRASFAPLEVDLDDIEDSESDYNQNKVKLEGADKDEKSKTREKQKDKEEREKKIQVAEGRLVENHAPENADEFEKLVRSSPNSSFVWIKYMAFMLSLADIDKARSIAERALRTINIREEEEKLNIWVAYFNLENEHGSPPEEAVKKVFERARQYCDPKKVYQALLGVYERTEQYKLADKLLDEMIKKFKQSCKVWLRKVESCLKQNEEHIQTIVNRALLCLPRHKHIKFISKTAILEYKCGVADRGRSLFEVVLRENPKRRDLWSVYLDQEMRLGDVDVIKSLFERAISLSLPPKKMKFLFKKYLEYEKSAGDDERVEYVKQRAMDKLAFLFGIDDHWGPLQLFEEISKQAPGTALSIEREGHTHGFCCTVAGSEWVAQHVATLIKNQFSHLQ